MRITTYHTKATRSVPLTVNYTCEFCEHYNTDTGQVLDLSGSSHISLIKRYTNRMTQEAKEDLEIQTQKTLDHLKHRRYQKLGLTCACRSCGKRQTWSSFIKSPDILVLLFLLGCVFFLLTLPSIVTLLEEGAKSLLIFLIFWAMILPEAIILLLHYSKSKKLERTNERYLPKFIFRDPDFAARYEKASADSRDQYVSGIEKALEEAAAKPAAGEWKCPSCWKINKNTVKVCDCGSEKPEE